MLPQWCILGDAVDLLYFLLQKILPASSVEYSCFHNVFHPKLRNDLTCNCFQLFFCWTNLAQTFSFTSNLYKRLLITLTVDMITQPNTEERSEKIPSEKKFYNASVFGLKIFPRFQLWAISFNTRQILKWLLYIVSDFEYPSLCCLPSFQLC